MTRQSQMMICIALFVVVMTVLGYFFTWIQGTFGDGLLWFISLAMLTFALWIDNRRLKTEITTLKNGDPLPSPKSPFEEEAGF